MLNMTPAAILSAPPPPEAMVSHPLPPAGQACPCSLLKEKEVRGGQSWEEKGFFRYQ